MNKMAQIYTFLGIISFRTQKQYTFSNSKHNHLVRFERGMNVETLASYAETIQLITILGAALYSWFQIREMNESIDSEL